jgi:uncharacterized protein (DUF58 family)
VIAASPPAAWESLEDPALFLAMDDLALAARGIVEGALHGMHRSRFRGHGAEFHNHREYRPGDDLRYLDWNLFARHGSLFTKEFHADTNLNLYLLVDASGSMATRRGPAAKFRYAARAAAALALLTRPTRDDAGLYLLRSNVADALPPRARLGQLDDIFGMLSAAKPAGSADIGAALEEIIGTCRQPGIVVLFSDFFDKEASLLGALRILSAQGHDVIAAQILDPWECALPASGEFEFVDLETGATIETSAPEIREAYAASVAEWRASLGRQCAAAGVTWATATTAEPLIDLVLRCLGAA